MAGQHVRYADRRLPATNLGEALIDSDELVGEGGFLAIRRLRLRNRRADGSVSPGYVCDAIARPYGHDAVVVAVWARRAGSVEVLVRSMLSEMADPRRGCHPDRRSYSSSTNPRPACIPTCSRPWLD
jgi:hypothetical protein